MAIPWLMWQTAKPKAEEESNPMEACRCGDGFSCPNHVTLQELDPTPCASGGVPWWPTEEKGKRKMAKKGTFKVTVKDGDTRWDMKKDGTYAARTIDYTIEHDNFEEALEALLGWLIDDYNENKVTLTYTPAKNKNKKN